MGKEGIKELDVLLSLHALDVQRMVHRARIHEIQPGVDVPLVSLSHNCPLPLSLSLILSVEPPILPVESPSLEEKAKIKKVELDITVVIDDDDSSEKTKDDLVNTFSDITVKMLGFDRFHLEQYEKQLQQYQRFLDEYLKSGAFKAVAVDYTYSTEEKKEEIGEETLTWKELQSYIAKAHTNQKLGGTFNYVDPDLKERYEYWKLFQHNLIMSFYYNDIAWM